MRGKLAVGIAGLAIVFAGAGALFLSQSNAVPAYPWPTGDACAVAGAPWQKVDLPANAHLQFAAAPDGRCRLWLSGFKESGNQPIVPQLWHSDDAGLSFSSVPTISMQEIDSISFSSSVEGWTGGMIIVNGQPAGAVLLHTTDGGASWTEVHLPRLDVGPISYPQVLAEGGGVFVSGVYNGPSAGMAGGILLKSEDEGKTWMELLRVTPYKDQPAAVVQLAARESTVMVLTSQYGQSFLEISRDGGNSFEAESLGKRLQSVSLVDSSRGFLVTGDYMGHAALSATYDGGRTWKEVTQVEQGLLDLQFVTPSRGYAFFQGEHGDAVLRVTPDGGRSWHDVTSVPEGLIAGEFGGVVMGVTIAPDGMAYIVCSDALYRGRL